MIQLKNHFKLSFRTFSIFSELLFQIYMMFIIETRCSGPTCQWHLHNNYNFYQCHVFFSSTYALHRYYTILWHFYSSYCKNSNCRMKKNILLTHSSIFFMKKTSTSIQKYCNSSTMKKNLVYIVSLLVCYELIFYLWLKAILILI